MKIVVTLANPKSLRSSSKLHEQFSQTAQRSIPQVSSHPLFVFTRARHFTSASGTKLNERKKKKRFPEAPPAAHVLHCTVCHQYQHAIDNDALVRPKAPRQCKKLARQGEDSSSHFAFRWGKKKEASSSPGRMIHRGGWGSSFKFRSFTPASSFPPFYF